MIDDRILVSLDDTFVQNPYPRYADLRSRGPVSRVTVPALGLTTWLVTRHDDARHVLADHRISKDSRTALSEPFTYHMLNSDPPDHTRLRALVSGAFTPRRVRRWRPRIERIADDLMDGMADHDQVDLIAAFAYPFAVSVIGAVLGVVDLANADFRVAAQVLFTEVSPRRRATPAGAMTEYLRRLIAAKRADPGDDLLTELVVACDRHGSLDQRELMSMVFLLLVAGHETSVNLIGNGMLALLRHPDQIRALHADPALLPGAVEEMLRYDSPANVSTLRHTTAPVLVGDTQIPEKQFVMVALASANRDPDSCPDPDRFDVRRKHRNLTFGHGLHHCLGTALARLEGEVAIGGLLRRFPGLTLAVEPATLHWRASTMMRGLTALPVRLGNRTTPVHGS